MSLGTPIVRRNGPRVCARGHTRGVAPGTHPGPDPTAAGGTDRPGPGRGPRRDAKLIGVNGQLLGTVDDDTRRQVISHARRRRYDRRQMLFHEGDPSDGMHLVDTGWVAIRVATPMGDIATLAVAGPGEPVGEQSLVGDGGRRSATVVAVTPLSTLYIGRDVFDGLRREHPAVDRFLAELFEERLRRSAARLLEALYVPTTQRVLRRVAELARAFGDKPLPLTQQDIATLAGATRPTVNRILRQAEEAGAVQLARGSLRVTNVAALDRLAL